MDDKRIIEKLFSRDESVLRVISEKYYRYCTVIANNITGCIEDAEECTNEVFRKIWVSVPPNNPPSLKNYIARITRNTALKILAARGAEKRGGNRFEEVLDELGECLSAEKNETENEYDKRELIREINSFLASLSEEKRVMFICRYWYADSVKAIAGQMNISENNVSVSLQRIRQKLRIYLSERGYDI